MFLPGARLPALLVTIIISLSILVFDADAVVSILRIKQAHAKLNS